MSEAASQIRIVQAGDEGLDRLGALWAKLRVHHAEIESPWREEFLASQFEKRTSGLRAKAVGGAMQVLLAVPGGRDPVGYCVSTVDAAGRGEIDSLFIDEQFRGRGLGRKMVSNAMAWLDEKHAKPIAVSVLAGNDAALRLYEKFGFQTRTILLQHVPAGKPDHHTTHTR